MFESGTKRNFQEKYRKSAVETVLPGEEQNLASPEEESVNPSSAMERAWRAYMLKIEKRFGFWKEEEPRLKMLQLMYDRLLPHYYQIPKGKIVGIDSPEINAFVRISKPDVYFFAGFLESLQEYCRKKNIPLTEDKIAFIIAHEMAHLEQGTAEIISEEDLIKVKKEEGDFTERQKNKQKRVNLEYDADRVALIRMAQAGFNPREGIETMRFFQSLGDTFISNTHPRNNDRVRELQDLVESPDTVIPNTAILPSPVAVKARERIQMTTHPGTTLYTKEGLSTLGYLLDSKVSNIQDVIEIASVALTYDIYAKVDRERRDVRVMKEMGKLIALHNLYRAANMILANFDSNSDTYGLPEAQKAYDPTLRISSFDRPPSVLTRYIDSEFVFDDSRNDQQEQNGNFLLEQLKEHSSGNVGSVRRIQSIVRDIQAWSKGKKIKGLDNIINKLERIRVVAEQIAQGEFDVAIEHLVENAQITALKRENFKDGKTYFDIVPKLRRETHKRLVEMDVEQLIAWATTDATNFFENLQMGMVLDELPNRPSDDLVMKVVPESAVGHEDIATKEGRERILQRLLLQFGVQRLLSRLSRDGGPVGIAENAGRIEKGLSSYDEGDSTQGIRGRIEELRPHIEKHFVGYYEAFLSLEGASAVGKHLAKVFYFENEPYKEQSLPELVAALSEQDCVRVVRLLPRTFPPFEMTANQLLVRDAGISGLFFGVEKLPGAVHVRFVKLVVERVGKEEIPAMTPEEELNAVIERILSGEQWEIKDINAAMRRLDFSSSTVFEQLKRLFSAGALSSIDASYFLARQDGIIFERISELEQDKKPHELLRILVNINKELAEGYVERIWYAPRFRKLAPEDQELFLSAVLDALPRLGSKKDYKYNREYQKVYTGSCSFESLIKQLNLPDGTALPKPLQGSISEEYLRIYTERHPDTSLKEAVKLVLKNGGGIEACVQASREYGDRTADHSIATDINHPYYLSDHDLLEIAEYCTQIDGPVQELYMRALAIQNGRAYVYHGTHYSSDSWYSVRKKDGSGKYGDSVEACFDVDRISFADNLDNIFRFVTNPQTEKIKTKGMQYIATLRQQAIDALRKTYKLSVTQTIEVGLYRHFDPIPKKICDRDEEFVYPFFDQKKAAAKYNPLDPSIFERLQPTAIYHVAKSRLMDSFFQETGLIGDSSIDPAERVNKIAELISESTDYRDEILVKVEERMLHEHDVASHEGQLRKIDNSDISQNEAQMLYAFYWAAIPLVFDAELQEHWSNRADRLYHKYLQKEVVDFDSEVARICAIYPAASFARDSALLALGDSESMKRPEQAQRITSLFFANNRRTQEGSDFVQQRKLEWMNSWMMRLNRQERKEYILWLVGVDKEPPFTARAFGGKNKRSVENVPAAVFSLTPNERKEMFLRLLVGERGVLDPLTQDDTEQMQDFVEKIFHHVFPERPSSFDSSGRELVHLAFTSVFKAHNPYRRARLFIQMAEKMKIEQDHTETTHTKTGEQLKLLLESLGPVAVKIGQVLSEERNSEGNYLLPEDIRLSLQKLKHEADTFHRIASVDTLAGQGEFSNNGITTLDTMVGAASIKQVFIATTPDGGKVIEKVRRPSIEKNLEEDLRITDDILEILRDAGHGVPQNLSARVRGLIVEEVNFEREVQSQMDISEILSEYNKKYKPEFPVSTPKVFNYSSEHIREEAIRGIPIGAFLKFVEGSMETEDLVKGYSMSSVEVDGFKKLALKAGDIRAQVVDCLLFQIFNKGKFHSDPHAGNIMISAEGNISFIDLGSYAEIEPTQISVVKRFILGVYAKEDREVVDSLKSFASELSEEQTKKIITILHLDSDLKQKLNLIANVLMATETDPNFDKFLKTMTTSQYLFEGIENKITTSIFEHVLH